MTAQDAREYAYGLTCLRQNEKRPAADRGSGRNPT